VEETIYTVCAVAGGVLVVVQVVLQAFGVFAETDVDLHDADFDDSVGEPEGHGNLFFGILSFKALCAFAAIFGLTGLIMLTRSGSFGMRVFVAVLAGMGGMIVVAMLMRGLSKLQSSGTVQIANAVGRTGSCYLRIPGAGKGLGKVTIELQGRSLQFEARTAGEEIPTGARVRVVGVEGGDTLEVSPA
jgi:membrane protein implicated in regulation of membrane protease activity